MSKHTPGPWQIEPEFPLEIHKGYSIAKVSPSFKYEGEAEANASLIAEAPELLSALVAMCETMEQQNWGIKSPEQWQTEDYKNARAVIAKATSNPA